MSARTIARLMLLGIALTLLAGCEPAGPVTTPGVLARNPANPPLPPPPPSAASADEAVNRQAEQPPATVTEPPPVNDVRPEPTGAPIPVTSPTYSPTEPAAKPAIRLSVGIALPQTLPDGTQVGVSVDYKVTGRLNTSAKYILVVESRKGETILDVKLSPQWGNLATFLPLAIRPDDSPFRARIDEVSTSGSRQCVSNVEPLR